MALGVTFPENEDVVAFGRKNEMVVLLVSQLGINKKIIGQLCWIVAEKSVLKGFVHYRVMQISRNALTHVKHQVALFFILHISSILYFSSILCFSSIFYFSSILYSSTILYFSSILYFLSMLHISSHLAYYPSLFHSLLLINVS